MWNLLKITLPFPCRKLSYIIDARPYKPKYVNGHIPGAVSIPDSQFDKSVDLLPADKDALLIYYCGGLACKLSHKSAVAALALGYTDVKVFSMGYPEWKKTHGATGEIAVKPGEVEGSMDIAIFKKNMVGSLDSLMIVDVRDTDEFEKGSFKNAVNIPVDHLEGKIKDLPQDKPVVFICSTGARSGEAYYMVQNVRPSLKNTYYIEGLFLQESRFL